MACAEVNASFFVKQTHQRVSKHVSQSRSMAITSSTQKPTKALHPNQVAKPLAEGR